MSPERFARIKNMLLHRQPDLTLCLEMVHKSNNLAAIVRTADAVGVHQIHAVWPNDHMRVAGRTATGSQKWVKVKTHDVTSDAVSSFRRQSMQILATSLSPSSVDYRQIDYTLPTAILLGQEKHGISKDALTLADQHIYIPMCGMVQSLNVSVAAALILYEAQRQRQQANMYNVCQLDAATCSRILFEGGYPIYAEACQRKQLPYPHIDEKGEIQASAKWWEAMRCALNA